MEIRRKPLLTKPATADAPPPYSPTGYIESPSSLASARSNGRFDDSLFDTYNARPITTQRSVPASSHTPQILAPVQPQRQNLRATRSTPNLQPPPPLDVPQVPLPNTEPKSPITQKTGRAVASAFEEARYFATGLVSHPYESTKHYTVLRHSPGLIFYTGPGTSIALTIFSDTPLPPDRSFWLQRRGWSGNTGLRAGVLFGTHGAWIDVTPSPSATVRPEQVKPSHERAWKRDMEKFQRKAPSKLTSHTPRETAVLRLPYAAEDGYLRVILCSGSGGKKHLCASPVFRLASTSLDSSSLRGASLKTLPLEAAVKVGSTVGRQVATRLAGPYVQTAKTFVSTTAGSVYTPSAAQMGAAKGVYDAAGIGERIGRMEEAFEAQREGAHSLGEEGLAQYGDVVGEQEGPAPPYPLYVSGQVQSGSRRPALFTGLQATCLGNISIRFADGSSRAFRDQRDGLYLGYALEPAPLPDSEPIWLPALVVVGDTQAPTARVVPDPRNRGLEVYMLVSSSSAPPSPLPSPNTQTVFPDSRPAAPQRRFGAALSRAATSPTTSLPSQTGVLLMAAIQALPAQPLSPSQQEHLISTAYLSLARPMWRAEVALDRLHAVLGDQNKAPPRSLTDRYVGLRRGVSDTVDKVPAHWLGIRYEGAMALERDAGLGAGPEEGKGGYIVVR
jgi:hypothetical protein